MRRPRIAPILILPLLAGAAAGAEPSPEDRLKSVEQQIEQSRAQQDAAARQAADLAAELREFQARSVEAARAALDGEAALTATEARLASLAADATAKRAALARDGGRENALLMALVRVATIPAEAMALAPRPPLDTLRGALVMARTVPPLEARTEGLRRDIAGLEAARVEISIAEARQRDERQTLADTQARLAALVAQQSARRDKATQAAEESGKRLAALAAEAGSLRDLIARVEAEKAAAAALPGAPAKFRPFVEAPGALLAPVAGTLILRFGAPDENGTPTQGLTFETRPGAQIVAPYDGQVEFAGPFRGYGQILIIAHGAGYHSLLAGLDRVDSKVGQWLVAGEPVGTMAETEDKPRLYLELRHNNQPINPAPWLATRVEKVNG